MTLAAIDIGSNTLLLLVAEYRNGFLNVLHEAQHTPRLAKGVDRSGKLSQDSMEKALEALKSYKEAIEHNYPQTIHTYVTATSAVRDAENKDHFIAKVKQQTGYEVKVLSGAQEARRTFSGAVGMLGQQNPAMVIDIGGGSTEIIQGTKGKPGDYYSYQMGSVRFTERFLTGDPPTGNQLIACKAAVRKLLENHPLPSIESAPATQIKGIGAAGTITSLAYMDLELQTYKSSSIHAHTMTRATVKNWINKVATISSDTLKKEYPVVMEGRAEVFPAGLLILLEIMNYYNLPLITVSTGGIRHGTILTKQQK